MQKKGVHGLGSGTNLDDGMDTGVRFLSPFITTYSSPYFCLGLVSMHTEHLWRKDPGNLFKYRANL